MTLRLFRCSCNPSQLRLPRTSSAQLSKLKVIINSSPTSIKQLLPQGRFLYSHNQNLLRLKSSIFLPLFQFVFKNLQRTQARNRPQGRITSLSPGRVKPVIFNCKLYELEVRTFDTNSFDAVFDHFGGHSGAHYTEHLKLPFETAFQNRPWQDDNIFENESRVPSRNSTLIEAEEDDKSNPISKLQVQSDADNDDDK